MDGVDRVVRRKSLKERLGLNAMSCCGGATWGLGPNSTSVMDDDEEQESPLESVQIDPTNVVQTSSENSPDSPCAAQSTAVTGMNLAAALAAERQFRAAIDTGNDGSILSPGRSQSSSPTRSNSNDVRNPFSVTAGSVPATPSRVSLMRLLEETDGHDEVTKHEEDGGGCDSLCCVCMGRKKGAAFIPCGHTFCRVCSRELWLNRGCCPLCNRNIIEILDIY